MLGNISGGLSRNEMLVMAGNVIIFIEILYESILELKGKIKMYQFDNDEIQHESTIRQ
jgi:hypothetical protein